jgi:hypothetical protein
LTASGGDGLGRTSGVYAAEPRGGKITVAQCWYCKHELAQRALKCGDCGEWVASATYEWVYWHFYLDLEKENLQEKLTQVGKQGWDVVSLVPHWLWMPEFSVREGGIWAHPIDVVGYDVILKQRGGRIYATPKGKAAANVQ